MATITADAVKQYDRVKEVKQFDDSKIGVKGLLDSGITSVPRIFHHPPEALPKPPTGRPDVTIPVIDLSGPRSTVIDQIRHSSSTLGFFQIINHGVPQPVIDCLISSIKSFHEQSTDYKMAFYRRESGKCGEYFANFDLHQTKAASWRDTLKVRLGPELPIWDDVPEKCREAVAEWDREVVRLGEELLGMLSEGLGLERERLNDLSCLDARMMVGHYYPYCPQPDLTIGSSSHTDPGVLTILVQNEMKGLQVKYGDDWIEVEPVPGAIIINIGDTLQILSNDEYQSVEHLVLANRFHDPRISVAVFMRPRITDTTYGPVPELISADKPAVYRQFILADLMTKFFSKGLDGKTLTNYYKISNTDA